MNNKGYMFVEILVVSAILMIGLLLLYNNFSSSITVQKSKINNHVISNKYKLFYIKESLIAGDPKYELQVNISGGNLSYTLNGGITGLVCDNSKEQNLCQKYLANYVYLYKCGNIPSSGIPDDLKEYLSTFNDCDNSKYVFVGKFTNGSDTTFSSLLYPITN